MIPFLRIFLIVFLVGISNVTLSQTSDHVARITKDVEIIDLAKNIKFYDALSHSPDSVYKKIKELGIYKSFGNNNVIFEKSERSHWGVVTIKNETNSVSSQIFKIHNFYLDDVKLYEIENGQLNLIGQSGDHNKLKSRTIIHRDHLFELLFQPHEKRQFLFSFKRKAKTSVSFSLIKSTKYIEGDLNNTMRIGVCMGMMLLFGFSALGTFIFVNRSLYLYYSLYILSTTFSLGNVYGFSFIYLYPNAKSYTDYINPLTAFAGALFFTLFVLQFLKIKQYHPNWHKFVVNYLRVYIAIAIICFIFYSLKFKFPVLTIHYILLLFAIVLLLLLAIISIKTNKRSALYFLVSFSPIIYGTIVQIMLESGSASSETFSEYTLLYCSLLEVLIISIGIAMQLKEDSNIRLTQSVQIANHEKNLNQKLLEGADEEKRRIALILHDTVGVKLRHIKSLISNSDKGIASNEIDLLGNEIRDLSHSMAPTILDFVSLQEAIKDLGDKLSTDDFKLSIYDYDFPIDLDKNKKTVLYNVLQELINNILKHSKASIATIQFLETNEELSITIEDNGIGFNVVENSSNGLGLGGIESRISNMNGTFRIESAKGKGTLCIISLPKT